MSDTKREEISKNYTEALKRSQEQVASSGSCCGGGPKTTTTGALSGYGEDLAEPQAQAAQSSFGCGNPLAFAGVQPGQTVVDLGSGAGLDLLLAAEKVGPDGKVIGIDMTDAMLDAARQNIQKAGVDGYVEARKGVIEDLPLEAASVDWIISNCVINLSTDKAKVFEEMARVVKPGGRFSVSDIVVEELPEDLREHAMAYSACIGGAISEADYLQGLRDAGFPDAEVTERMVYTAEQLEGVLSCDFGMGEEELATLREGLKGLEGKVWSAKVVGMRG